MHCQCGGLGVGIEWRYHRVAATNPVVPTDVCHLEQTKYLKNVKGRTRLVLSIIAAPPPLAQAVYKTHFVL